MKRRFAIELSLLAALLVGEVAGSMALAQPPPGGPGPGGPGGPPPFGGRGRFGPRPSTPIQTPLAALKAGLKLSDNQAAQVQKLQAEWQQQRETLLPRPEPGAAPPDPEAMRANFEKLRAAEQKANNDFVATLTPAQKQALPGLLRQLDIWREAGIPVELYGELKLSADQQKKIETIVQQARPAPPAPGSGPPPPGEGGPGRGRREMQEARRKMREQVMGVLSAEQRKRVQAFIEAHPRPPFGGGPGGPGEGFPPPPPPDGDGPPPPPPGA